MKKPFLEIGKIVSVHGVKGFVKVLSWCNDFHIFKSFSVLYFDLDGFLKKNILDVKFVGNMVCLRFEDVFNRQIAKEFVGKIIYVDRNDVKLEDGEYFIQDLIGVRVCDFYSKEVCYGVIVDVLKTGANDVYVISDESGVKRFVPVIDDVVVEKNLKDDVFYIKVLEGLFDV